MPRRDSYTAAMSFAPIVLGFVVVAGLLVAIAVMAWDGGEQAAAPEGESAAKPEVSPVPRKTASPNLSSTH